MAFLDGYEWNEYVEDIGPSEVNFGPDGARATMTLQCAWEDVYGLTKVLLGYSYRGGAGILRRVIPTAHGFQPLGGAPALDAGAKYEKARLTVEFSTLSYDIRADDDATLLATGEWMRYTEKTIRPASEGLSLQQGAWLFTEPAAEVGKSIPGGKSQIVNSHTLVWTWKQVPHECLFTAASDYPTNLVAIQGKVNDDTFAGRPAGTLLCLPPILTPKTSPLAPNDLNTTNRLWDVEFHLLFKNPPNTDVKRGHNLAPIPGDATGRWGYFTHNGLAGGNPLYAEGAFETLFTSL
jgi:hypothetical protein